MTQWEFYNAVTLFWDTQFLQSYFLPSRISQKIFV